MKDLYNNLEIVSVLDPIVVSATATHPDIDLADFNSACLVVNCGLAAGTTLGSSHKFVFVLYDKAESTDDYAVVETADMLDLTVASGVVITIDAVGEDNSIYKLGYVGGKRYLQLVYTKTGSPTIPLSIEVIKSHGLDVPAI